MIANVHESHATAVENTDHHATTETVHVVQSAAVITGNIAAATIVVATALNVRNEVAEGTNTAAYLGRLDEKVTNVPRKTANIALIGTASMIGKTEDVTTRTDAVIEIETIVTKTEIVTGTATIGTLIVTILLNVLTPLGRRRSKYRLRWHLLLHQRE